MIGHEFPYTNLHDVNIDWILQVVKEFNEKYHGIDDAIDEAIASLNAKAEELETAMQEYMQGLEEETTANINAIYAQFQTQANEAIQAIISNKELALSAIDSEMNSKLTQVSTLLNSLPHDYQDALNQMQIINATLNGTNNYPELVQGHYADAQESDSKTLVPDNYRVSSLLSAGCASRKLRTRVANANGIIRDIIYWTGWGDSAVSHPVPVSASTTDEKTLFTYTFPPEATYFTVVFASDYNMLTAITPSDLEIEFQWIFDSLKTLEVDDETDISGNSDGFILSKDGDVLSSYTAGTEKSHMDVGHTTGTVRHYFKDEQARNNIADIEDELNDFVISETETITTTTELTGLNWEEGYVTNGGAPIGTAYKHVSLNVVPGDVISASEDRGAVPMRFVDQMNGSTVIEAQSNQDPVTVLPGVDAVVISISNSYMEMSGFKVQRTRTETLTHYTVDMDNTPTKNSQKPVKSNGLYELFFGENTAIIQRGTSFPMVLDAYQSLKKGAKLGGTISFDSFTSATIGMRLENGSIDYAFTVDITNITYHFGSGGTSVRPHGLTNVFAHNLQLSVSSDKDGKVTIEITTDGVTKYETWNFSNRGLSTPFLNFTGTNGEGTLSFVPEDISKDIWIFGDSYVSYLDRRWMYYYFCSKYSDNALVNGYSGEASPAAKTTFENLLKLGRPKYLLWCMGMNDGTDTGKTDEQFAESQWKTNLDAVLELCSEHNIIPILATIPNVPAIKNDKKNAWVRGSQYQYVDFAKAVGADANGDWYEGMQSILPNDSTHPSVTGAKALYAQALTDCPQLCVGYAENLKAMTIESPNGTKYRITVNNSGVLSATAVVSPS